ncbi:hypothetical protein GCM10009740_13330 [Terrabacter terrae]|uniref:YihY/virulence factor BrkB family protein n=1 Tax=Terrabacter terrae TaxID=318434 RepID=A0ABN2TZ78_9MICO
MGSGPCRWRMPKSLVEVPPQLTRSDPRHDDGSWDSESLGAIPGETLDPPAQQLPRRIRRLESRGDGLGKGLRLVLRTSRRFVGSRATLLAAGTTYYLFLALFSTLTLGYGLSAAFGAERLSAYITEAVSAAFPGLVGQSGLDASALRGLGQVTSLVSAVGLLYGATGAVLAASRSVHAIYGAPVNTRDLVRVRVWAFGWFLVLAPVVLLSFVSATITTDLSRRLLDALGVDWTGPELLLGVAALAFAVLLNFVWIYWVLGWLGGIRPRRWALIRGAGLGALVIEVLKQAMALLVGFVLRRPQYGALAAPIGILFVLYLQSVALYAVASLTAALAQTRGSDPPGRARPDDLSHG